MKLKDEIANIEKQSKQIQETRQDIINIMKDMEA